VASTIIAVHQAGRRTGIVRRVGNQLAGWRLLVHGDDLLEQTATILDHLAQLLEPDDRVALVALPTATGRFGLGASFSELRRAVLLGGLLHDPLTGWAPLLVAPADYGAWQLAGYPAALIGPRERRGGGRLRACRAAWDLAGAALPDGPPSIAADTARLAELASVTVEPVREQPGYRAIIRVCCGVCGTRSTRYVPSDAPAEAGDPERERTRFVDQHLTGHLQACGRAGSLLVLDTAQALTRAATQAMTTTGIEGVGA
jgi:hypothetical protein